MYHLLVHLCNRPYHRGNKMIRRLSCFALLLIAIEALAQTYPAKPIRLVVPFPAGESVDATARLVGQSWSAALGQQILVDNRGGGGGTIGSEAVATSPASSSSTGPTRASRRRSPR